jgi:hypothetical protein
VSDEAVGAPEEAPDLGLVNPRGLRLARTPVRSRELAVTLSAWRLFVLAEEGEGTITRLESGDAPPLFRGEGVCLGWPQERLAAAYDSLRPRDDAPNLEFMQLG